MLARAPSDPEALRAILHDDIEWEVGAINVLGGESAHLGPDAVMDFFRSWVGAFSDWGYDVGEVIDDGDRVIAQIHQFGRGRTSGIWVEQTFWQVWTLRDAKAIRGTNHATRAEALEAGR